MADKPLQLTREEVQLIAFYRELPVEQQLELLEQIEIVCNHARRMDELAIRPHERGILIRRSS